MYVLKYIQNWGLNFEFMSKGQREYITENRIIQKQTKMCQLFEINANHFITKQNKYYNNISPDLSNAILNCCLADTFIVKVKCYALWISLLF